MKTALYVATVARTYRMALDDYAKSEELYRSRIPVYKEEIAKCTYRQYTTGFFFGKPDHNTQIYDSNVYMREYTYLGIVGDRNNEGMYAIEQRNKFSVGEEIEVIKHCSLSIYIILTEPDRRNRPYNIANHTICRIVVFSRWAWKGFWWRDGVYRVLTELTLHIVS